MSFVRVLSCLYFRYRSRLIQNPAIKLQNINALVAMTFSRNKLRWFCSTENSKADEGEKVKISFVLPKTGEKIDVEGIVGQKVLKIASENGVGMQGACAGKLGCKICHVYVDEKSKEVLPEAMEEEKELLNDTPFQKENSRLSCQCILSKELEGAIFTLPTVTKDMKFNNSH